MSQIEEVVQVVDKNMRYSRGTVMTAALSAERQRQQTHSCTGKDDLIVIREHEK